MFFAYEENNAVDAVVPSAGLIGFETRVTVFGHGAASARESDGFARGVWCIAGNAHALGETRTPSPSSSHRFGAVFCALPPMNEEGFVVVSIGTEGAAAFTGTGTGTGGALSVFEYRAVPTALTVDPPAAHDDGAGDIIRIGGAHLSRDVVVSLSTGAAAHCVAASSALLLCEMPAAPAPSPSHFFLLRVSVGQDTVVTALWFRMRRVETNVVFLTPAKGWSGGGDAMLIAADGLDDASPAAMGCGVGTTSPVAGRITAKHAMSCISPAHALGLTPVRVLGQGGASPDAATFAYVSSKSGDDDDNDNGGGVAREEEEEDGVDAVPRKEEEEDEEVRVWWHTSARFSYCIATRVMKPLHPASIFYNIHRIAPSPLRGVCVACARYSRARR